MRLNITKNFKRRAVLLATVFSLALAGDVAAQCSKTWVRKKCVPKISPFIHNGQMNTLSLKEGGKMESTLTFYSGQDYRILVCAEETLENVSFVVSDMNGKIIFDSKAHNNTDVWDFKVKTTTDLKVEVNIGKNETGNGTMTGCVSVLVGFKSK
ncbi:MAG: hypothetical protein M3R17_07225 [Bacteroidota bacterium]|nr:hypothetical protein [Bacteroidota bacterium]